MPAKSKAQFAWLHTEDAEKALGKAGVKEWIKSTGSPSKLPKRSRKSKEPAYREADYRARHS